MLKTLKYEYMTRTLLDFSIVICLFINLLHLEENLPLISYLNCYRNFMAVKHFRTNISCFVHQEVSLFVCLFLVRQPPSGPGPPHS
jgi:hypothetical protein